MKRASYSPTCRERWTASRLSIFVTAILYADLTKSVIAFSPVRDNAVAFAAGGGFGRSAGNSLKKGKKTKEGKKQKRGGLLSEVETFLPPEKENNSEPKLDRWGLPIPTTDDLFPPMPPGTEIIPVNMKTEDMTLSDIRDALKDHIEPKELENRFSEDCLLEKEPVPGRPIMKLKLLHRSPPVLAIENFFTDEECNSVVDIALSAERNQQKFDRSSQEQGPVQVQSATFSALAQSKRTSTSWFCYYSQVPTLLAKAQKVIGIPILEQMEEPQIVRYKTGEEFSWHYDEVPVTQLKNGGQRLATLLVYLNDVERGGGTVFRDLVDGSTGDMLTMKPKKGSALLFFPAYRDGRADDRTLHKGEIAGDEKWIIQMWTHEKPYSAHLPEANFQQSAQQAVDDVCKTLGYQ